MADGGCLKVLDGTQLSDFDFSLPDDFSGDINGVQLLDFAHSRVSQCHYSLPLPDFLKSLALQRLNFDISGKKLDRDEAQRLLADYVSAIADQLKDEPLVVSILDGNTIRLFLEDEDDFAMLAENLFTDLDAEDEGKLSKSEILNALDKMGVEMGVPSSSEFPMINDILKKHGAEGEEKLGQAQFAQLLQPILQDLADALALKHVTVVHNLKITNGSKLRKFLADQNKLDDLKEKLYKQILDCQKEQGCAEVIRSYLEKNGNELGLPPLEVNEAVPLMYNAIFADIESKCKDFEKNEFRDLLKKILENFAEKLEVDPVFHDTLL
ncbi:uncharacterized protein LOC130817499 [Amaranthus tricolor]|uniref:uncharacterized protein LOC130817499 n=1 Tax=Amaranthus tricolor TaxID=29722 RepID=UPI00258B42DC|nr:uncharacterized protein LOC130817499 [Amaranthus tricolor]